MSSSKENFISLSSNFSITNWLLLYEKIKIEMYNYMKMSLSRMKYNDTMAYDYCSNYIKLKREEINDIPLPSDPDDDDNEI